MRHLIPLRHIKGLNWRLGKWLSNKYIVGPWGLSLLMWTSLSRPHSTVSAFPSSLSSFLCVSGQCPEAPSTGHHQWPHPVAQICALLSQETSFCSGWELTQRPKTGQYAETERYWSTPSRMGCLHQTPSLRAHGVMEKRRQKGGRSQRQWMTPRKLCPPDTTGLVHV